MLRSVSKTACFLALAAIAVSGCDTGSRGSGAPNADVDLTVTAFMSGFRALTALENTTTMPLEGSQDVSPTITVTNGGMDAAGAFSVSMVAAQAPNMPVLANTYDRGSVTALPAGMSLTLQPPPVQVGAARLANSGGLVTPPGAMMATHHKAPGDNHLISGLQNEIGLRAIDPTNGIPGMYTLGVVADSSAAVAETDENNNLGLDMTTYDFQAIASAQADLTPSSFISLDFMNNPPAYNTNFNLNFSVRNVGAVTSQPCQIFVLCVDDMGNQAQPVTGTNNLGQLAAVLANTEVPVSLQCNLNQNVMNPGNFQSGSLVQFFVWVDFDITAPMQMPPMNSFMPANVSEPNEYNNGQIDFFVFQ